MEGAVPPHEVTTLPWSAKASERRWLCLTCETHTCYDGGREVTIL